MELHSFRRCDPLLRMFRDGCLNAHLGAGAPIEIVMQRDDEADGAGLRFAGPPLAGHFAAAAPAGSVPFAPSPRVRRSLRREARAAQRRLA